MSASDMGRERPAVAAPLPSPLPHCPCTPSAHFALKVLRKEEQQTLGSFSSSVSGLWDMGREQGRAAEVLVSPKPCLA